MSTVTLSGRKVTLCFMVLTITGTPEKRQGNSGRTGRAQTRFARAPLTSPVPSRSMGAMGIAPGIRTMGAAVALLGLLAACAGAPTRRVEGYSPAVGEKAADTARSMIGRPYKFAGDTPAGFDCSGLVRYSYLTAGMDLPHGTRSLMSITRSVGIGSA